MKIIAIIPARGGSTRLPRKSIVDFLGKPLIAWTIELVLESKIFDRVFVSTEDEEIAEISKSFGAEVPFMRPVELANNTIHAICAVLNHVQKLVEASYVPDIFIELPCTSPLRTIEDITGTLKTLLENPNIDMVRTVHKTIEHSYMQCTLSESNEIVPVTKKSIPELFVPSQMRPKHYIMNCNATAYRMGVHLLDGFGWPSDSPLLGYEIPFFNTVDIDTYDNLVMARLLMQKRLDEEKEL